MYSANSTGPRTEPWGISYKFYNTSCWIILVFCLFVLHTFRQNIQSKKDLFVKASPHPSILWGRSGSPPVWGSAGQHPQPRISSRRSPDCDRGSQRPRVAGWTHADVASAVTLRREESNLPVLRLPQTWDSWSDMSLWEQMGLFKNFLRSSKLNVYISLPAKWKLFIRWSSWSIFSDQVAEDILMSWLSNCAGVKYELSERADIHTTSKPFTG